MVRLSRRYKTGKKIFYNKSEDENSVTVQVGSYSDMKLLQIFYFYLLFTR